MKSKFIFILIILLAAFLRLYRLNGYPPSFWQDIAANAYDAYSIAQTGKDQWGTILPFPLIKSMGDYKTAMPVYFLIPGIKIFGLNEFGVRFNMAVVGILTVVISYFVGKKIGKNVTFGLLLAFLIAISPWHIGLVRHGWEATLGIFFFLTGTLFFFDSNKKSYLIAAALYGLGSYAYHPMRVFIPSFFFLASLIYVRGKNIFLKTFLCGQLIFLLIFIPNLLSLLSPEGRVRIEVNRFDKSTEFINQKENPLTFALRNYFRLYSFDFLFVWGSTDAVYEANNRGVAYFWLVPFISYGFYLLIKRSSSLNRILLLWLFLWPIPVIIVSNPYNLVKTAHMVPLMEIMGALGLYALRKNKKLVTVVSVFIILSLGKYFVDYYALYPLYSSGWYQGVEKNTFEAIDRQKNNFQNIVLSQKLEPYIYLLFYEKINPWYYQTTKEKELQVAGKFGEAHLKRLGKYAFSTGIENRISDKTLYAFPPEEIPQDHNYRPAIFSLIKDHLGNNRIVVFSFQKI